MARHTFRGILAAAALLTCAAAAAAGQTARDLDRPGAPAPTGTASIVGAVTVTGTGQPARNARVTLSGGEIRGSRSATTDEQGRFAFLALPAGRYTVAASKGGHVTIRYGQRQPGAGRPGTAIQLADGQQFEIKLQLPRGGVLTGTVLDEHAEPSPGTQVRVMRYVLQGGARTLQSAGSGATDDRGIFRVYGLQPGDYVVCATPRNSNVNLMRLRQEFQVLRQRAEAVSRTDAAQARQLLQAAAGMEAQLPESDEERTGYAPVCYPGTTSATAATPISLGVGEERRGVDFQLQLVSIGSIDGVVVSPSAGSPQNIQVMLVNSGTPLPVVGTAATRAGADGRFHLANVPPGQYTLVARGTFASGRGGPAAQRRGGGQEATRMWAAADVSVDGRPLTDVLLSLQPGMSVSGQISFEGTQAAPADLTRLRVSLVPADAGPARALATAANTRADAAGRFTIPSVMPGRYRVSATGAGSGWFAASAIVSGEDSLDFPFEVKPNENVTGVAVTMSDRPTELSGTLVDERGQPATDYTLIVFPDDQRYWGAATRRIQAVRPSTDGTFVLRNLPPGDYRLSTVIDPEPGSWTEPSYLEQLAAVSMPISLAPGEKKIQNVRLAGQ